MPRHWIKDIDGVLRRLFNPFVPEQDRFVWDDMIMVGSAASRGTTPPTVTDFGSSWNMFLPAFDGNATTEQLTTVIQFNHKVKTGSVVLRPHVHWSPTDATVGDVLWKFDYTYAKHRGIFPTPTTRTVVGSTNGVFPQHLISGFGEVVLDIDPSAIAVCRIYRDPTDSLDTYNNKDATLLSADWHSPLNSLGSRQEFIK